MLSRCVCALLRACRPEVFDVTNCSFGWLRQFTLEVSEVFSVLISNDCAIIGALIILHDFQLQRRIHFGRYQSSLSINIVGICPVAHVVCIQQISLFKLNNVLSIASKAKKGS